MLIMLLQSLPTLNFWLFFAFEFEVGTGPSSDAAVPTFSISTSLLGSVHHEPSYEF